MFKGEYNEKKAHDEDLNFVLERGSVLCSSRVSICISATAWRVGMDRMIITGGNAEESKEALQMAKSDCIHSCVTLHTHYQ